MSGQAFEAFAQLLADTLQFKFDIGHAFETAAEVADATVIVAQHFCPGVDRILDVFAHQSVAGEAGAQRADTFLINGIEAGFRTGCVLPDERRIHTRLAHQVGVLERCTGPVVHPAQATETLQHGQLDHAVPALVVLIGCQAQGVGNAQVEHGQRPDQAGIALAASSRVGALGFFDPAGQHRTHVVDVALLGRTGADHQCVHFLVVGVAFEQVGDLAA
ncbi:hypothetical protein D9M69_507890 [compost metagenome]